MDGRHSGNLIRLERLLEHPGRFRLVLAEHNAPRYRDRIIELLADRFPRATTWPVPADLSAGAFIEKLRALATGRDAVQVIGIEDWPPEVESRLFVGLNYRREDLAAAAPLLLVLWLPAGAPTRFARAAPDLWAWRTAVLDFALAPPERAGVHDRALGFLGEDAERLRVRRREIDDHLKAKAEPGHADGVLLLEAARIHERLGEWDDALAAAKQALAVYRGTDDQHSAAVTQGKIADILQARGELDEALSLHEQRLPVAKKMGDIDLVAAAKFKIAQIRLQRGDHETTGIQQIYEDLAEAFAIYLKLGRPDGIGHVGLLLAEVLAMRGQKDDALEVLDHAKAAFDKLGHAQNIANVRRLRDMIQAG